MEEENAPLDVDIDGKKLFSDDIVSMVQTELSRRREARRNTELQWVLNANFLAGHQNCDINVGSG